MDDRAHDQKLRLDGETQADLQLFAPESGSLFEYCDRCRTDGGRRALQRRMRSPWSEAERIRGTQDALRFIEANLDLFERLPGDYLTLNVERYLAAALPTVRATGTLEFAGAALLFRANEDQFYTKIVRGVALTHRLVASLRKLNEAAVALSPGGELEEIFAELAALLDGPELSGVGTRRPRWYWEKLRLDQAFRVFGRGKLTRLLEIAFELDALVSLAAVVREQALTFPTIGTGAVHITADELRHPLLPDAVANDVRLDQSQRLLFLTGPNMAGKTTYLRALVSGLYLAHLGMGVPAQRFEFVPMRHLLTAISLRDDLSEGISYFRAEALRMRAVAEAVGSGERTIAVFDEPFKGTNVKDAYDATLAVIKRLAAAPDCLFVVTSHLIELAETLGDTPGVAYGYFEAIESEAQLAFDFKLRSGVSDQRLGMRVLKEEGVFELLD